MRHVHPVIVIAALSACRGEPATTHPVTVRAQVASNVRYVVQHLPTLDARLNRPSGINNDGWVAGFVNRPGNATRVAALWRGLSLDTLGTLGGPNSNVQWPGLSNAGTVVGIAETAELDPLHEEWSCTAFFPTITGHICRGFVWESGTMTPLLPLGGNQSFAADVNSRGQVVGWAETDVIDPTCNAPQVLQFRAVLWQPKAGLQRELPPLPGDSTSAATAINERGQVAGISGDCDIAVGQLSARHAVLWDRDTVIDIGNLGGEAWHTPMDMNGRGDIVGFSNPSEVSGIDFRPRAFLWTRESGIQRLDSLPGETTSQAVGINSHGQIVGISGGALGNRAVLWENGIVTDLNSVVMPGYPHRLLVAQHINDDGVIVGRAVLMGTTIQVPFVARPIETSP